MQLDISWTNVISCLHTLKQCFIWFNFTMSMIIFVPYMTLILLDLTVYLWRITGEYISTLLIKPTSTSSDSSTHNNDTANKEKLT